MQATQVYDGDSQYLEINSDGSINVKAPTGTPLEVSSPGFTSTATVTRPANTTAYTANDVVGEDPGANMTFSSIGSIQAGHFIITGATLRIDIAAVPSGMGNFKLHLYDAAPTAIADNAAYNLPSADRTKYLGNITFDTPVDLGDTLYIAGENINMKRDLAAASTTIYGILATSAAYTPSSADVFTVDLHGMQC